MLSLQSDPLSEGLKQQVQAASRDVNEHEIILDDEDEMETTPHATPICNPEPSGQVEYYVDFCVDKFAMTYKTEVVYPKLRTHHVQ